MGSLKRIADWFRPAFERSSPQMREQSREADGEQPLRCRRCGTYVTTRHAALRIMDSHEHRFSNPAGIQFHIGCFGQAPGCRDQGPATHRYSWFPGAAWTLTFCATCAGHLGWHFVGAGMDFFGLIVDRLRSD